MRIVRFGLVIGLVITNILVVSCSCKRVILDNSIRITDIIGLFLSFTLLVVITLQLVLLYRQNSIYQKQADIMFEQSNISGNQLKLQTVMNKLYELELKIYVLPGSKLILNKEKNTIELSIEMVIYNPTLRGNYIRSINVKGKRDIPTKLSRDGVFVFYMEEDFKFDLRKVTIKADTAIQKVLKITVVHEIDDQRVTEGEIRGFAEDIDIVLIDISGNKYETNIKNVEISNELIQYLRKGNS